MDFAKQFNEAAQKAVLLAVETGSWTRFPWIETMIKQSVRESLKSQISVDMSCIVPDFKDLREVPLQEAEREVLKMFPVPSPSPAAGEENREASFESNSFEHVEGFDWRIIVSDRTKNHRNSWVENFIRPPTQEEFEYQFRHFHARTHHVHVNHWVNGSWETITTEYVPHWNKEKPKETLQPSEEWPEGKKFRIKFWDQRIDGFNYVYFDSKPGGIVLNKYHAEKCFAVTEQRPEGI